MPHGRDAFPLISMVLSFEVHNPLYTLPLNDI